jgi:hypothetical protein
MQKLRPVYPEFKICIRFTEAIQPTHTQESSSEFAVSGQKNKNSGIRIEFSITNYPLTIGQKNAD